MDQALRTWCAGAAAAAIFVFLLLIPVEVAAAINGLAAMVAWIAATFVLRKRVDLPVSLKIIHAGVGLFALGAIIRIVEASIAGDVVVPGFADLAYGPAYLVAAYGAMAAGTARRALSRVSDFIDAAVISLTVIAVVFVVAAPYLSGSAPLAERAVTAGFVIADSVLLAVSAVLVLGPGSQTRGAVYLGVAGFAGVFLDLGFVVGLAHSELLVDTLLRYAGVFGIAYFAACRSSDYVDFPKPGARRQHQRWWLYAPALVVAIGVVPRGLIVVSTMIACLSVARLGVAAVHADRMRRLLDMQSDLAVRLADSDSAEEAMSSLSLVASELTGRSAVAGLKGDFESELDAIVIRDPDGVVALAVNAELPDGLWVACQDLVAVTALAVRNVDARTARVEARMARNWKILAGGSSEAGFILDSYGLITTATPNVTDLIGQDPIGKLLSEVLSIDTSELTTNKAGSIQFEEDGRWFEVTAQPASNNSTVVNVQDVTSTILAERTDPVTGLANVRDMVAQAAIEQSTVVVFSLDSLPTLLSTYGRAMSDVVLRELATRLSEGFRDNIDALWRGNGDTFVVIAAGSSHPLEWIESRRAQLAAPVIIAGSSVSLAITATAVSIEEATAADEALRLAESALRNGLTVKGGTAVFSDDLRIQSDRRFLIESALMSTDDLAAAGFTVNYQPILDSVTGAVSAVEALLRWTHPVIGQIFPDEFIAIAEQINQISRLDTFVLNTVMADRLQILRLGPRVETQINLSPVGVTPEGLHQIAKSVTRQLGDDPLLTIEITESAVEDATFHKLTEALAFVRSAGIGVSLDDFGTGASNLVRLSTMPLSQVKLAGEFTEAALPDVTSNVIEAIHQLGCNCVVENVETVEQARVMASMGADLLQGWFVAKAMPLEQLLEADLTVWSAVQINK